MKTRKLARHALTCGALAFATAAVAQSVTLAPAGPVEVLWGQPLAVVATATSSCTVPPPLPSFTLRASGALVETRPADLQSCSAGVLTEQATFASAADLPFGTYALTAQYQSGPSSLPLIIRLNPEFSFVIGGGQGVLRTGLSGRGAASTCSARAATLEDRARLQVPVPPPNMRYPYEHVAYFASNCAYNGATTGPHTQKVVIEYPDNIPADAELWLYSERATPRWQRIPATFTGRLAAFDLVGGMGGDNTIGATVTLAVPQPISADFELQDLWWGSADGAGWGLNIAKNGHRMFATLFIYDDSGRPQWVVMPSGTWDPIHQVFHGDLFVPTSSPFSDYDPYFFAMGDPVGKGSLSFTTEDEGNLDYTIKGVAGGTRMVRYKFAPRGTATPQYAGMWWGGVSQDGWGISIQQQGQTLFATWYTYGADGKVTWFYMPGGAWISPTTYSGTLYRTTSSPWVGRNYNAASLRVIPVGTMRLDFTNPNAATMTSTVDGATVTRPISRFEF